MKKFLSLLLVVFGLSGMQAQINTHAMQRLQTAWGDVWYLEGDTIGYLVDRNLDPPEFTSGTYDNNLLYKPSYTILNIPSSYWYSYKDGIRYLTVQIMGSYGNGFPNLTRVILADGIEIIGSSCFCNNPQLQVVKLPKTLKKMGNGCFANCPLLKSLIWDHDDPESVKSGTFFASYNLDGFTMYVPGSSVNAYKTSDNWKRYDILFKPFISETSNPAVWNAISGRVDNEDGYILPDAMAKITSLPSFQGNTSLESFDELEYFTGLTSIPDYAFRNCTNLKRIVIPEGVTSIGSDAFHGCTNLESIILPKTLKSIGNNAFYGCSGLTSITIPNSVTSIGERTFYNCTGLTNVTIPNSVTSIGNSAFYGCTGLTNVTIGNSVTSIGNDAFRGCSGLTSIIIPNSVISIGGGTFSGCSGLMTVTISNSITSIGNSTFHGCTSLMQVKISDLAAWCNIDFGDSYSNPLYYARHLFLNGEEVKDLVIPNSVTSIGATAFSNCTSLTSATIPNSVIAIGKESFAYCFKLTSVNIPSSVNTIGDYAFLSCKLDTVIIPSSVKTIGKYAFYDAVRKRLILNDGLEEIGDFAFAGMNNKSINIPSTVKMIGKGIFSRSAYLTQIIVSNNPFYDSRENCNAIIETASAKLVSGCSSSFIPSGVKAIGDYAFYEIPLSKVIIPQSVNYIGERAFSFNNKLKGVYVYHTEPEEYHCEETAFYDRAVEELANNQVDLSTCTLFVPVNCVDAYRAVSPWNQFANIVENTEASLDGLEYTLNHETRTATVSAGEETNGNVVIPEKVNINGREYTITAIGNFTRKSLTSVTIPSFITSIGEGSFAYCSGLESLKVSAGSTVFDSREDCNAIIESASNTLILGCKNTIIPSSVTSIGLGAFAGCSGLSSIDIPNSVTSIGEYAFNECTGLSNINIPNSVTSIGYGAFAECSRLTSIDIPNSVTYIGDFAFFNSRLKSIDIPNSVTNIGQYAFCQSNLSVVYVYRTNPSEYHCNDEAFGGDESSLTLHVPAGCKEAYAAIEPWSNFGNIVDDLEPTAINLVRLDGTEAEAYYNLQGQPIANPQRGQVVIVRYFDGTSRKMMVK